MKRLVGALLLCASTALSQENGWTEIQNGWSEVQNSADGLTYTAATDTVAGTGTITAKNLTATGLATPGAITVTPVLTMIGSITTVAGSALVDGDGLVIKYTGAGTIPLEFDLSPGDGTTGGAIPVLFTAGDSADLIRDNLILAINAAAPTALTASSGGAATVALTLDVPGVVGGTNTEAVADAGFAVTGFVNPTAATTYTYRIVWRLPDGSTTEGGAASSTAAGHATLSVANRNDLSWTAGPSGTVTDVYRTVGGATTGLIAEGLTVAVLSDTGLPAGGETAPTVDGTGRITSDALTAGRVAIVGAGGRVEDDAGLTYDAATDTLTVGDTVYANALELGGSLRWQAFRYDGVRLNADGDIRWGNTLGGWFSGIDSGLRRVSPGLVGVTSGGSNLGSLQAGNLTAVGLATPAITAPLTVNGTPGATTYGYKAVAFLNDGTSSAASAEVTIATGPAVLNGTDNITVAWPAVTGQAYSNLYRTTGGAAPPKLIYSGTAPSYVDIGTEISAETPATKNTTGYAVAARAKITGLVSYANNAAALAGGLVAGDLYTITGSDPLALAIAY